MFKINAATNALGLIGYPVEHSFSSQVHNFMAKYLNVNYVYLTFEVEKKNVKEAIYGIRALNVKGINVTAPYKCDVMEYLDEISEQAKIYGAVNTIKNVGGKLIGYNTDGDGLYMSIKHMGWEIKDKDILILGAGGAARTICVKFALLGAKSITIINRTQHKAEEIKNYVSGVCRCNIYTRHITDKYDIVVNATSMGMYPDIHTCPIDGFSILKENALAVDLIYNPRMTKFLQGAHEYGAKTMNGLGMLIYQAMLAFEIFTDIKIDTEEMGKRIESEVFGV